MGGDQVWVGGPGWCETGSPGQAARVRLRGVMQEQQGTGHCSGSPEGSLEAQPWVQVRCGQGRADLCRGRKAGRAQAQTRSDTGAIFRRIRESLR